jgi:aspartate/methionine/tyrosine aminotransferase
MKLADARTKLILVNSPHNPTGATISDAEMDRLHEFTSTRGIQFVSDEVYHPIYHGRKTQSASRLPQATVIHDFSKAFALAGVRTGWMIEHDRKRRERYVNARTYFSISNNSSGEMLAEIAMRRRHVVLGKTQEAASLNLQHLDRFMAAHCETLGWIRPQGGMTAFPWLLSGENTRPFCQAAAAQGILLAPGDCFDSPSHFRLGFAATGPKFSLALDRLSEFVKHWPATPPKRVSTFATTKTDNL